MTDISIIIPVFNEAEHIASALESVLLQRVDFPVEIIIVDDCSTDETFEIAKSYADKYSNIILIKNPENRGKGYSFMQAYAVAKGKYFHVLDGDDYFLNFNKLQIQRDFLDANDDYFAVCHNSLRVFADGKIMLERIQKVDRDFEYSDCMSHNFYAHTSTFMFRKIGNALPETFLKDPMRGDSACLFYHAFHSKGKVRYLSMIGSVYNFHNCGIWTSLPHDQRMQRRLDFLDILLQDVIEDPRLYEYTLTKKVRDKTAKFLDKPDSDRRQHHTANHILTYCRRVSSAIFDSKVRVNAFQGMHSLEHIDSLCEAVGGVIRTKMQFSSYEREYNEKTVAIMLSGLIPNGGGIAKEVKELVSIHTDAGWKVHIICTNDVKTEPSVVEEYIDIEGVSFWYAQTDGTLYERIAELSEKLYEIAVERLYPFITHNDVVQNSVLQRGVAKEIVVDYVYDHGTSLGIYNSSIDKVIAKTESQAAALAQAIGANAVLFIPPFLKDKYGKNPYVAPIKNTGINTASAAARSYKVESDYRYSYSDVICQALKITGGTHYHYGPLSEKFLTLIAEKMEGADIPVDRFVHIPWADDFSGDLLKNHVHLFIAPFPICSARIAIEVMSAGIPILNHVNKASQLPQSHDFTGESQMKWYNLFDFSEALISLDPKKLLSLSEQARSYYETNNEYEYCKQRFLNMDGKQYSKEIQSNIVLRDVTDVSFYTFDDYLYRYATSTPVTPIEKAVQKMDPDFLHSKTYLRVKRKFSLLFFSGMLFISLVPGCDLFLKKKRFLQKINKTMAKRY